MTALDFNDKGKANVSFIEFNNYMNERKENSDYTEEKDGITTTIMVVVACSLSTTTTNVTELLINRLSPTHHG